MSTFYDNELLAVFNQFLSKVLGAELENSGVIGFPIVLEEVSNSILDIYN